jgi:hypothetical protein
MRGYWGRPPFPFPELLMSVDALHGNAVAPRAGTP